MELNLGLKWDKVYEDGRKMSINILKGNRS